MDSVTGHTKVASYLPSIAWECCLPGTFQIEDIIDTITKNRQAATLE